MLDPAYIRDHVEKVREGLRNRGLDADKVLGDIATFESLRKRLIGEYEGLKRQQNTSGDEIAKAKRQGQDTSHFQETGRLRNQQIKQLGIQLDSIEHQRDAVLLTLPNLPHDTVPVGKTSEDNPEARRHGEPRVFDFEPKAHWDLATNLGLMDFERAPKISGSGFLLFTGMGARL